MEHNRMLQISTAGNRKATYWPKSEILWSDFTDKLKTPVRGNGDPGPVPGPSKIPGRTS